MRTLTQQLTLIVWLLLLGVAVLWAASETLRPTSITQQSGYTDCTVGEIDEDPDSADAEWCDVGGANNVNTNVRVAVGDPVTNPTTGTNAQEIRVQLRKTNHSTNPTCSVDIYEGSTQRVDNVISSAISSTSGTVLSGTWTFDTAAWTDDTGAAVEIDVGCVTGSGNPGNRASGETGAVEWNATTEDPVTNGPQGPQLNFPLYY